MYIKNSKGPKMEPCGMPESIPSVMMMSHQQQHVASLRLGSPTARLLCKDLDQSLHLYFQVPESDEEAVLHRMQ